MTAPETPSQAALITSLQAKGGDSKKYQMVRIGLVCVMAVYVLSLAAVMKKPEVAVSVASLAQMVVLAIGALVSIYAGSQAAVDWKTTSSLAPKAEGQ